MQPAPRPLLHLKTPVCALLFLCLWHCPGSAHAADSLSTPATKAAPAPKGIRFVYLVRHGMYDRDDNADDRTANGLDPLGHEQAKLLGARLHALPLQFALLVSSDLTRARETAEDMGAILGSTPLQDSLLEECSPASDGSNLMKDHAADEVAACDSRLETVWKKYFQPSPKTDEYDLLVCHGNVIRWLVCRATGMDLKNWTRMDIANCSLTVISVRADGTARLVMYSDVGNIPVEKQTWLGRGPGWAKAK
jgi:serine/threonine-protein phosphatase PGAM5